MATATATVAAAAAQPATKITEAAVAAPWIREPAPAAQPAPKITEAAAAAPWTREPAPVAPAAAVGRGERKEKRGRPRKYGPDGGLLRPLQATPISASVPDDGGGGGGGWYTPAAVVGAVMKRGRGRPVGFVSRAALVLSSPPPSAAALTQLHHGPPPGDSVGCASGANFTPHILNVAVGEDVNMKVISFSQQGPRAICIISANGAISNVTLRQHDSLGGTVTYEGRFELLSLSGSFTPTGGNGGARDRSGGMSVSLAAADGRVIGGGVAGLLVAAGPVQVVVGSFFPSYHGAKKPALMEKKTMPPAIGFTISSGDDMEDSYSGGHLPPHSVTKGKTASAAPFRVENWTAPPRPLAEAGRRTPPSLEAEVIELN